MRSLCDPLKICRARRIIIIEQKYENAFYNLIWDLLGLHEYLQQ